MEKAGLRKHNYYNFQKHGLNNSYLPNCRQEGGDVLFFQTEDRNRTRDCPNHVAFTSMVNST